MKIITRSAVTAIVAATGLALSLVVVTAPALASTDDTYPLPTVRQSTYSDDLFVVSYSEGGQVSAEYLTFDEWAKMGYPKPLVDAFVPGTIFAKQQSSDSLYALTDGRRHLLTFDEWKATGYQSPTVKPDHFVKYPWSASIYSVSFFGAEREAWVWRKLTFEEWSKLGQPAPSSAGWIEGSFYYKYKDSDVVYVALDGSSHALTFAEWRDAGYPQPQVFTSMEDMN